MLDWWKIGAVAVVFAIAFKAGAEYKQRAWDAASAKLAAEQFAVLQAAANEQRRLNGLVERLQGALAVKIREAESIAADLREAIAREPVTQIVRVEAEGENCPEINIALPDPAAHRSLWNCALDPDCRTASNPGEAGGGNERVPAAVATQSGHRGAEPHDRYARVD